MNLSRPPSPAARGGPDARAVALPAGSASRPGQRGDRPFARGLFVEGSTRHG